ncbi:DUF2480 family protein [Chryseobacterium sp. WG14]|uniref:DUF2480 family protein n=1 Tax=unclassified Chryseobacterium TaxID=2593645 RepID=UPI001D555356|nr:MULTISPECIES: DUF2480 family protein [unclassified Chryseobacterium]MCQ9636713.1 DUF2480 family protein [Chryseobacterium sp. WG23]MCQ9640918.1 DUF2480 family protein [Chryseobacterium sp. WG14]CAH0249075.1 hypothetical protein SRABI04_03182 [Chryseobacterium sp. Bi04]
METFINKAEASGIIALDLLDYKPTTEIVELDIKDYLFMGMVVKEKEFKESIAAIDFSVYNEKAVGIICSTDAIIPPWVYMFLMEKLSPYAVYVDLNNAEAVLLDLWKRRLTYADLKHYKNQKVVVRARADHDSSLYLLAAGLLKPLVKSLMYGEIGLPKVIFKT